MKTETVHTRITPEIKSEVENIFTSLGLTMSQAIALFLQATINHRGLPFELTLPKSEEEELFFASNVAMVDGVAPSDDAKRIMRLYSKGEIDYETAMFAIGRLYSK